MVVADERCVGGRYTLENELRSMYSKISAAKSRVDSHLSADTLARRRRKQAAAAKARPSSAKVAYGDERAELSRKLAQCSLRDASTRRSFSASPGTFGMASVLSENRRRRKQMTDRTAIEHSNNVYHLHRRVKNIKPSICDVSKPVYIRRNVLPKPVTMSSLSSSAKAHKKLSKAANVRTVPPEERPPSGGIFRGRKTGAALSPAGVGTRPSTSRGHRGGSIAIDEEKYRSFRQAIMEVILRERIYEEEALQELFLQYLDANADNAADLSLLTQVIQDVCLYLDVTFPVKE